jgi:hypothetical protein
MIVVMLDANYISERISSLKQELSDLKVIKACYWRRSEHVGQLPFDLQQASLV